MTDQPVEPRRPAPGAGAAAASGKAKSLGDKYQDYVTVCWVGGSAAVLIGGVIAFQSTSESPAVGLVTMALGVVALLLAIVATGARWGVHIADDDRRGT